MKNKFKTLSKRSIVVAACWLNTLAFSQITSTIIQEQIAVTARPSPDSISIRWAPLDFNTWRSGNRYGYRIERYVMTRNGTLLAQPEKIILHAGIRPLPESQWESLVHHERFAAIAAQALYGNRFEVNLKDSNLLTIANKVRENEQRFAFALFSADMSPRVAKASGLWFTDNQVNKSEKYLYRVVVNSMDSLRGSIFISPVDRRALTQPQNLKAEFKGYVVSLKWDNYTTSLYTAYIVERSVDGRTFHSISDFPLVTVSPSPVAETRHEYAMDSIKDLSKTYYYRVKGVTPFGEESPPSNVVSGKGTPPVEHVPYISGAENINNHALLIHWDFPETDNKAISGFSIERSPGPQGNFTLITQKPLPPHARSFQDKSPFQTNYYRVIARGLDQEMYPSHVYYAPLIDSIPPAAPVDLKAHITDGGKLILSWKPNMESDLYGYRVYKAYHGSEELAQITSEPLSASSFADVIDLNTLNEHVYYSVMAVDQNQNHSGLSGMLKVNLPDKIKPQAPLFLPIANTSRGVSLRWIGGGSDDIVKYIVYRKAPSQSQWEELSIVEALSDSVYEYTDNRAIPGETYYYTLVAVDDAGWESEPAHAVTGMALNDMLRPAVTWKKPIVNREENRITLLWNYSQPQARSFKIFRAVDGQALAAFRTIGGDENQFTDNMIPGRHYRYRILALFADGGKSFMSEEMAYQY